MKLADVLKNAKRHKRAAGGAVEEFVPRFYEWLCSPAFDRLDTRSRGVFHPSAIIGDCRRALAYDFVHASKNEVRRDPRLQLIFEVGNGIHYQFQKLTAQMCVSRRLTFAAEFPIPRSSNPWFISGRMDGMIDGPDYPAPEGLEYKSINLSGFGRLFDRPLESAHHQGNLYLGLTWKSVMHYIYVCKDNSSIKEFIIPFDQAMFEEDVSTVESILLVMQRNKWPERCRPDCHDPGCVFNKVCWSKATVTSLANETTQRDIGTFEARFYAHRDVAAFR